MNRNGKIARLPADLLRELNQRLDRNEDGGNLLNWLNTSPEVRTVVDQDFNGAAITKQNLHEWREGGFAEWRARRECFDQARDLAGDADDFTRSLPGRLADRLATVLTARYAALLHHWDGEVTDELQKKLRVLHGLCRDVTCLRRGEHSAAQLALQEGWLEQEREKTEEEVVAKFEEWSKNVEVHDWLVQTWIPPEERERRKREMFGLPPQPQDDDPSSPPPATPSPDSVPVQPGQTSSPDCRPGPLTRRPPSPSPEPTQVQPGQTNPPLVIPTPAESQPIQPEADTTQTPPPPAPAGQTQSNQIPPADLPPLPTEPPTVTRQKPAPNPFVVICHREGGSFCQHCQRSLQPVLRCPTLSAEEKATLVLTLDPSRALRSAGL
jgi:hypothetical protein